MRCSETRCSVSRPTQKDERGDQTDKISSSTIRSKVRKNLAYFIEPIF